MLDKENQNEVKINTAELFKNIKIFRKNYNGLWDKLILFFWISIFILILGYFYMGEKIFYFIDEYGSLFVFVFVITFWWKIIKWGNRENANWNKSIDIDSDIKYLVTGDEKYLKKERNKNGWDENEEEWLWNKNKKRPIQKKNIILDSPKKEVKQEKYEWKKHEHYYGIDNSSEWIFKIKIFFLLVILVAVYWYFK